MCCWEIHKQREVKKGGKGEAALSYLIETRLSGRCPPSQMWYAGFPLLGCRLTKKAVSVSERFWSELFHLLRTIKYCTIQRTVHAL